MKTKRTKALEISKKVRERVYERDGGLCVICGAVGMPNAHYIARSQGGLGVEENILTLCFYCHSKYDQSIHRNKLRRYLREYLQTKYPEWDESKLIYKKE